MKTGKLLDSNGNRVNVGNFNANGWNVNIAKPLAKKNRDNPEFPLRRIVKCCGCGFSLTAGWSKGKKQRFAYYLCQKWCSKAKSIPAEDVEAETRHLLRHLSLSSKALDLVTTFLRKSYYHRVSSLQKRREQADEELRKLYETRQSLIEKNLAGIYSDDIFREQNRLLEEKIATVQITKNDDLITKYNIENVTKFIKEKFKDLAKTYDYANLQQKRMLLCSIFPSGLTWNYPGYLNTQISKFFQVMREAETSAVTFGRGDWTRTSGLMTPSHVLYQLSYTPKTPSATN